MRRQRGFIKLSWKELFGLVILAALRMAAKDPVMYSPQSQFPCSGYDSSLGTFFFFDKLMGKTDYTIPVAINNWNGDSYKGSVIFNICTSLQQDKQCPMQSDTGSVGFMKLTSVSNGKTICVGLASTIKYDKSSYTTWDVSGEPSKQNNVNWLVSANNHNSSVPFKTTFHLNCGKSENLNDIQVSINEQLRTVDIYGSSKNACAVEAGRYIAFLTRSKIFSFFLLIVSVLLIVSGIFFLKYAIALVGFTVGVLLTVLIAVGSSNPYTWGFFMYLFVILLALIVGLLIGVIGLFFSDIAILTAGGCLGFFVGFKLVEGINASFNTSSDVMQIIVLSIFIIVGIALAYFFEDCIVILATAFGGAFLFTLALGALRDDYPDLDNTEYFHRVDPDTQHKLRDKYVMYFGIFVLLGVLGTAIQCKRRATQKAEQAAEHLKNNQYQQVPNS